MVLPRVIMQNILILGSSIAGIFILIMIFSMPIMGMFSLGPILSPGGIFASSHGTSYSGVVHVTGIDNEVTIIRDNWGVPHIYGKTHADVAYALGYVHAQERLFQMEMTIRTGLGRMSEIMGESSLEDDIWYQTIGIEKSAKEMLAVYNQERAANPEFAKLLDILDAYCEGVNHVIDHKIRTSSLPVEFKLLGFEPEHWSPLKTFVYNRLMSLMLTYSTYDIQATVIRDELFNGNTTAMDEIFPLNQTTYQVPVIPNYGNFTVPPPLYKVVAGTTENTGRCTAAIESILDRMPESVKFFQQSWIGSNNWVVDGNKSSTGKPILANDMHLSISLPHIWYEAHLVAPEDGLNVYGYTLTGTPVVIVGFNTNVAWGMTNVANDAVDWYEYVWNADGTMYWSGKENGWKAPTAVSLSIPVKGKANHTATVLYTEDGVIMGDMKGLNTLAMRWSATESPTYEILAMFGANIATNWQDFNDSMQYFQDPTQNVVFADKDGNIALRPTGRFIKRNYFGEGRFVFNGSDPAINKTWDYIPYNELPLAVNPDQHYLASANQRSAGPDYQYFISSAQDDGYRGRSINRWLSGAPDGTVDVDFMKDAQCGLKGIYDICAESFTPFFIRAIQQSGQVTSGNKAAALASLVNWNSSEDRYQMRGDLTGPTVYYKVMKEFRNAVWDDDWFESGLNTLGIRHPQDNVLEYLVRERPDSSWFDDITTGETESRDDLIVLAFNSAVTNLEQELGTDTTEWIWGNYHQMKFNHMTGISSLSRGPFPHNGSRNTLLAAAGLTVTHGPSERMVVDFNNISNSWSVLPTGNSGILTNPHYDDQIALWLAGDYHLMLVDKVTVESFPASHMEAKLVLKSE
ncbi:MAG: penicillin acylase family protein [Candidatus Hodarchaeales archaeon]